MKFARVIFGLLLMSTCAGAANVPAAVVLLNGAGEADTSRSILVDAGVIRYVAKTKDKYAVSNFAKARTVEEVIEQMKAAKGDAEELYHGLATLTGWPAQNVVFKGVEHRPAFRYAERGEKVNYSIFGLTLNVGASPAAAKDGLSLAWQGNYSWSTNFIPKHVWETVLLGVMNVGSVMGAGFKEEAASERTGLAGAGGLNLGTIFKKKVKPTEVKAKELGPVVAEQQSYLDAFRQDHFISGQGELAPNQMTLVMINPESDSSVERFYLALRYEWQ
jgi:hypothetical protein